MSSLLDKNEKPVPVCNVHNPDSDDRFFVVDPARYQTQIQTRNTSRNFALGAIATVTLFLCIFSLNFGSSGWTAGNMLTFGFVVAALLIAAFYGSKWNESHALVTRTQVDGTPCTTKGSNSDIIHCGKNPILF